MPYKSGFGPFAGEVYRAPLSYPFRDGGLSGAEAARRAIDVVEKQVGADQVACVVIEPVQGEGGFIEPAPGFLPALAAWCRENGALFVADEVQTGVGRTGDWFACEAEGVVPDLVVVAKGVAGGMPLSAVTGRAELVDAVHTGGLGGTYGGNPVACAAALAALDAVERDGLLQRARDVEALVKGRLHALAARDSRVGDVRGRGAMLAVELVGADGLTPDPALAAAVAGAAKAQGVIVLTCGTHGNVLRFLPPLSTSDELLHDAFDVLDAAFAATATTTATATATTTGAR
ncbi:aminotransferase class III-fold pyridoxal phosphate-dependent enzyme, partial [Quadrisphaera oryzae]